MAIYDIDAIHEQEAAIDEDTLLDGMLEACNAMMDALTESTAAQRHYGTTAKEISKYGGNSWPYDKKNLVGKMAVKKTAKIAGDEDNLNKALDKAEKVSEKVSKRMAKEYDIDVPERTDREKEEDRVRSIAMIKAATGATMSRAAKAGYDVKGEFDKVHAKTAKKKAIKETCLTILSVIDDI